MIHGEPALEEVLSEPIVLMLARRDGMSAEELRVLVESVRRRLAGSPQKSFGTTIENSSSPSPSSSDGARSAEIQGPLGR